MAFLMRPKKRKYSDKLLSSETECCAEELTLLIFDICEGHGSLKCRSELLCHPISPTRLHKSYPVFHSQSGLCICVYTQVSSSFSNLTFSICSVVDVIMLYVPWTAFEKLFRQYNEIPSSESPGNLSGTNGFHRLLH